MKSYLYRRQHEKEYKFTTSRGCIRGDRLCCTAASCSSDLTYATSTCGGGGVERHRWKRRRLYGVLRYTVRGRRRCDVPSVAGYRRAVPAVLLLREWMVV